MTHNEFRNKVYSRYFRTHFSEYALNRPTRESYERHALGFEHNYGRLLNNLQPNSRVLDVACGMGQCSYWLQKKGCQVEGIDLSCEQLELAKKICGDEIKLYKGDALDFLRRKDMRGQYDCIIANDFLEHLIRSEALQFIESCFNALIPGGVVILRTPNATCPGAGRFYDDVTHERPYTNRSLTQLLNVACFEGVHVFSYQPYPFRSVCSVAAWLAKNVTWRLYKLRLFLHDFALKPHTVGKVIVGSGVKQR